MFTSIAQFKEFSARHLVVIALVALAVVEVLSLVVLTQTPLPSDTLSYVAEEQGVVASQPILRISEIQGSRIDDEAAMVVVEESSAAVPVQVSDCFTLPLSIWVFLVIAYMALLAFNFSYTFERATRPQWFFEVALTVLALTSWYAWDGCRTNNWFPFAIVKSGLIIFALYAYLLEKKLSVNTDRTEKTESMF